MLPGTERLILGLRELGRRVVFLSNNPTKDPEMYAEKLTKLGLETPAEEPLKYALREAGIEISKDPEKMVEGRVDDARVYVTPANATDTKTPKSRPASN